MFEVIYCIKELGKFCNANIGSFESKEKFDRIVETYRKEHPQRELIIVEDENTVDIIKYFHSRSPRVCMENELDNLRSCFEVANDYLSSIESRIESLENQFCKKDEEQ